MSCSPLETTTPATTNEKKPVNQNITSAKVVSYTVYYFRKYLTGSFAYGQVPQ